MENANFENTESRTENDRGYRATIVEGAAGMTKKEQIMFLDLTDCVSLDEATKEGPIEIDNIGDNSYAVINVHNEKAENKDYTVLVLIDEKGIRYRTGSESFYNAFRDIYDQMQGSGETWGVKAFRKPSKNYAGRDFLTCSVI